MQGRSPCLKVVGTVNTVKSRPRKHGRNKRAVQRQQQVPSPCILDVSETHNLRSQSDLLSVQRQVLAVVVSYRPHSHLDKSGVFSPQGFYDTLRYAKKVSDPPPRYIMTGGARLAFSDTHKHHTYRKI